MYPRLQGLCPAAAKGKSEEPHVEEEAPGDDSQIDCCLCH